MYYFCFGPSDDELDIENPPKKLKLKVEFTDEEEDFILNVSLSCVCVCGYVRVCLCVLCITEFMCHCLLLHEYSFDCDVITACFILFHRPSHHLLQDWELGCRLSQHLNHNIFHTRAHIDYTLWIWYITSSNPFFWRYTDCSITAIFVVCELLCGCHNCASGNPLSNWRAMSCDSTVLDVLRYCSIQIIEVLLYFLYNN